MIMAIQHLHPITKTLAKIVTPILETISDSHMNNYCVLLNKIKRYISMKNQWVSYSLVIRRFILVLNATAIAICYGQEVVYGLYQKINSTMETLLSNKSNNLATFTVLNKNKTKRNETKQKTNKQTISEKLNHFSIIEKSDILNGNIKKIQSAGALEYTDCFSAED